MVKVQRFEFNVANANCYVVSDETEQCVIIDPCAQNGNERKKLLGYIEQEHLTPIRCLLTHAHFDHLLCCNVIRDSFGLLPEVHQGDEVSLRIVANRISEEFGSMASNYPIIVPEHYLRDGEIIHFGNHQFETIHTPGHSPGSVFYYCKEANLAFSGDTLFYHSIGRSDLMYGWIEDLYDSLKLVTRLLPDDCVIFPGHDGQTTIGEEKAFNPYF